MVEGEEDISEEMKPLDTRNDQGHGDLAGQGLPSNGPSVTTNPDADGLRISKRRIIIGRTIGAIVVIGTIISISFNIDQRAKLRHCQADPAPLDLSSCSQDWVKDREVAYYFSKVEGNWNSSQSFCSSCGGSLVAVENAQEMDFIMKNRPPAEYWVGLQRETVQQPWKRQNGSVFNDWYPIQGEGLCAYLSVHVISSTWCANSRYWICKKLLQGSR